MNKEHLYITVINSSDCVVTTLETKIENDDSKIEMFLNANGFDTVSCDWFASTKSHSINSYGFIPNELVEIKLIAIVADIKTNELKKVEHTVEWNTSLSSQDDFIEDQTMQISDKYYEDGIAAIVFQEKNIEKLYELLK